jgi:hypothetical protein
MDRLSSVDGREQFYTLLGVRADGVVSVVDLVPADQTDRTRLCAQALLHEHQSCEVVEVWRDGAIVEKVTR